MDKVVKSKRLGELNYTCQGYISGPNVGKTNAMLNDAIDLASNGSKVTIATLEMPRTRIIEHLRLIEPDFVFDDECNIKIVELEYKSPIISVIDLLKTNCDVLIIDYIQILDVMYIASHSINTEATLALLGYYAKKYNTPIITAIQANRNAIYNGKIDITEVQLIENFNILPIFREDEIYTIGDIKWTYEKNTLKLKKVVDI